MDEPQRAEGSASAGLSRAGRGVRWEALGPAVAAKLEPSVEMLVDDVFAAIARRDVPREWISGRPNARHGVERGLRGLLTVIAGGPHGELPGRGLYFGFGRGQLRAGRSLAALLAAYHHGARETWRAVAQAGSVAELPPETLHALGDAILACLAEISAASAEGFAFEQEAHAGDRDGTRRRLLAALLRAPAPPPQELAALCAAAGWPAGAGPRGAACWPTAAPSRAAAARHARAAAGRLPGEPPRAAAADAAWSDGSGPPVAAIACDRAEAGALATRLPPDALVGVLDDGGWALLPDPDAPGRPAALRGRLGDVHAALGPTVALAQAAESARWARLTLALGRDRPPALLLAAEHRVELLLLASPLLASALAEELLAPLAPLAPATRARLLETLEAWLRHGGAASAAAEELHVHAQTVRYRLGRLRALLGPRIDGAEGRLELQLALRARRLSR